jgi:CHAT domain-containing protein
VQGGVPRAAEIIKGKAAWKGVPGFRVELDRVEALAGGRKVVVLEGKAATCEAFLEGLGKGPRWAHVALHGFNAGRDERVGAAARSSLTLCGLILPGGEALTAEAVAGLGLDGTELVVLSGSRTALGDLAEGEGVLGLPRAFHLGGARNVVGSLWDVDDQATCALMGLFYHHLWQEKRTPAEALRQAQLAVYRHHGPVAKLANAPAAEFIKAARLPADPAGEGRAPARLWAGFIVSGVGR